jgi:ribosome-associated protein
VTVEIPIRGETIRLGQLLKLAGVVDSGSEAKSVLAAEEVRVNDVVETRRGRQLHLGDRVRAMDAELLVAAAPEPGRRD